MLRTLSISPDHHFADGSSKLLTMGIIAISGAGDLDDAVTAMNVNGGENLRRLAFVMLDSVSLQMDFEIIKGLLTTQKSHIRF